MRQNRIKSIYDIENSENTDIIFLHEGNDFRVATSDHGLYGTRWYNNERLLKSDNFRRSDVETTHIIQLSHMMACWKGQSLNYVGKIVLALF